MPISKFDPRGFTLIELLIVVAIIAILAAIAVPNFLEAQTRAKVSRVRADVRSVATALEFYRVDSNKLPPEAEYPHAAWGPGRGGSGGSLDSGTHHARIPSWLTTPIAYMNSLPEDVFIPNKYKGSWDRYVYFNFQDYVKHSGSSSDIARYNQTGGYVFYSFGPDQANNIDEKPGYAGAYSRYDASNGTLSYGNIVRTAASPEGHIPYNPHTKAPHTN